MRLPDYILTSRDSGTVGVKTDASYYGIQMGICGVRKEPGPISDEHHPRNGAFGVCDQQFLSCLGETCIVDHQIKINLNTAK
jgi:hypothetical protein